MYSRQTFKDYRFWCIATASIALVVLFMHPIEQRKSPVFDLTFIIDITRSMNVEDYQADGQAVSRLEFVKQSLRGLLLKLPCESKVGLGVFTERRSTLLFEPVEVCSGFAEIDAAIAALDWRMAWAADSRIAKGLLNTLEMRRDRGSRLVFMTDGQEAPPVNPRYRPDFSDVKGAISGLLVGVGDMEPAPIPKYNSRGEQEGFYTADDVPHRSTFGLSSLNPEEIEGYNARNAPFGSETAAGNEHLSYLHEAYLQQLSAEAGLYYHRLTVSQPLIEALQAADLAEQKQVENDVRWRAALASLVLLLAVFV
ncbi:MAG: VWA domain-containing protein [Gammaproteobacteria bacterium HGW-Gammaproteobacteria-10]|nr:MAG: VWA domain-containing protein [Gammaproteobacteria bacterium HGW-Gammaproteobacteria-10]